METILVDTQRANGTIDATGVVEMCLVPTASAVIKTVKNAVGVWICDLHEDAEKDFGRSGCG